MSKKKIIFTGIIVAFIVILNVLIYSYQPPVTGVFEFQVSLKADHADEIQLYHGMNTEFTESESAIVSYTNPGEFQQIRFNIGSTDNVIRLDLGDKPGKFEISDLSLVYKDKTEKIPLRTFDNPIRKNQVGQLEIQDKLITVLTTGNDSYFAFFIDSSNLTSALNAQAAKEAQSKNLILISIIDVGLLVLFLLRRRLMALPLELISNRALIMNLAFNDFKTKYAGSYLGIVWAFIQPIVTILVYWFVFSVGFKSGTVSTYPFVLYLVTGIVPWFFFQDALNGGTNSMLEYNYLVKKVVFKISILPIVKIISAFFVHVFFVIFALLTCAAYGYTPSLHVLQLFYYSACTFIFVLGLVYASSAIVIFFRDLAQIINILLQVGVWMTPIMWDLNTVMAAHPLLMKAFKLNPFYYIVTGYRDSMLGHVSILAHANWGIYFWVITAILFGVGAFVFKRLKPHFADIL